jgi:hypothetical protein
LAGHLEDIINDTNGFIEREAADRDIELSPRKQARKVTKEMVLPDSPFSPAFASCWWGSVGKV